MILESGYRANFGRSGLKFQYVHNANVDRRIDPSVSNIVYTDFDNSTDLILIESSENQINVNEFDYGQLIYFYDSAEDRVMRVDTA